ncbi:MAG: hypothetical protein RLY93_10830 [Sumerlaeia bacterium]
MATATMVDLNDTWAGLKANPVFRRTLSPRGLKTALRSPIARVLVLTAVGITLFEWITRLFLAWWPVIFFAVAFWFCIKAVQYFFCWFELSSLATTGTLDDYLNSGLSRADVAMGIIFPAFMAEMISTACVILYFALTAGDQTTQIFMLVIAALIVFQILRPPSLFLPDVEGYLRKRNPVALFFISIAVLVPLIIWFTIFFALLFGIAFGSAILGLAVQPSHVQIIAFIGAYFLVRYPNGWWMTWRLKRFYSRYRSFDDLFERYIEHGDARQ